MLHGSLCKKLAVAGTIGRDMKAAFFKDSKRFDGLSKPVKDENKQGSLARSVPATFSARVAEEAQLLGTT